MFIFSKESVAVKVFWKSVDILGQFNDEHLNRECRLIKIT